MTEEIRTDNTETLKNALERITELEKENEELKEKYEKGKELVERMKDVYLRVTDKLGYEGIKEEQEIEDFIKEIDK